jgi:pyruvate dehydrogenase E1 component beta subunit
MQAWVAHVPGLRVVMPSTPYDAKGLLKSSIRDDNPVIFLEDKLSYDAKGPVPDEEYTIPLGVADVKRQGKDVTLVATSSMVQVALNAAEVLEQEGVSAEVVDPRCLKPLDTETILASVRKTSRAVVIDQGCLSYGASAEIASMIADEAFFYLDAPVKRIGALDVPVPMAPVLELTTIPNEQQVVETVRQLML